MKIPTFIYFLNERSVYFRISFIIKFLFFILISIFAIANKDLRVNFVLSFLIFILITNTGFTKDNPKPFKMLFFTLIIFSLFWLFFSRIEGQIVYFTTPWNTFFSDKTLNLMLIAISKWLLIVQSGLFFMVISSEEQLTQSLIDLHFPKSLIFSITIAFNTVGFTLNDLDMITYALISREYNDKGILNKMKKIYYIGGSILLSNIKKIDTLNQAYLFRHYENMYKKNEK